jgi:hypothetical protein
LSTNDGPLAIPVNGSPFAGELVSIDADGNVQFRTAAGKQPLIRLDELVRWGHPAPPGPQTLVLLGDGSRLVTAADWSDGAAVQIDGDTVVVRSDTWDEVRLERSQVRGLVFAERSHPRDRQRLENEVRSADGRHDIVLLTNQDRLTGTDLKIVGGTLELDAEAGHVELPLSRVEAVILAVERSTGGSAAPRPQPPTARLTVGIRDGSLITAKSIQTDAENLAIVTAGGVRLTGGTRDDVVFLQSHGGDFVYLSDLQPAEYRHVPYLDVPWSYERDRNLQGEPLSVGGNVFLKGIAMHSAGRLTYRLDGKYRRFDAAVALDDSAGGRGSVSFAVYLLRDGKWQEAFNSGTVRGGAKPQDADRPWRPVSVDVSGAAAMTLTVDFADRGDELDHADWLDARLVK